VSLVSESTDIVDGALSGGGGGRVGDSLFWWWDRELESEKAAARCSMFYSCDDFFSTSLN
jgi:hypothetical protein